MQDPLDYAVRQAEKTSDNVMKDKPARKLGIVASVLASPLMVAGKIFSKCFENLAYWTGELASWWKWGDQYKDTFKPMMDWLKDSAEKIYKITKISAFFAPKALGEELDDLTNVVPDNPNREINKSASRAVKLISAERLKGHQNENFHSH